jgi:hypothetical protein
MQDANCLFFCRNTGSKERIWESDKEKYYESVVALMSDKTDWELPLDELKILTSKESKTEHTVLLTNLARKEAS